MYTHYSSKIFLFDPNFNKHVSISIVNISYSTDVILEMFALIHLIMSINSMGNAFPLIRYIPHT